VGAGQAICIVTPDIIGPIRNGGIGTHCFNLARFLAGPAGQRVTVLFTAEQTDSDIGPWKQYYDRLGIEFVWIGELPSPAFRITCTGQPYAVSSRIQAYLRQRSFDVIHFQDWQANGIVPIQAKLAGLAHDRTLLTVTMHSPSEWQRQGMEVWPAEPDKDALTAWCERSCCRHADLLISPTQHMFDWATARGWELASSRRVVRLCYLPPDHEAVPSAPLDPTHLVFFGRLETRKGLQVFCRGVKEALARRPGCVRQVSFLGKIGSADNMRADAYLRSMLPQNGGLRWQIRENLDSFAAIEHIRRSGGIVVIPSLLDNSPYAVIECIAGRIPFLAARTGGIPELVDPRVLFEPRPDSLAQRLLDLEPILGAPLQHPWHNDLAEREWLDVHTLSPPAAAAVSAGDQRPVVSVCVTLHDRADCLPQALAALASQDYPRLEVVVFDDASSDPHSLQVLEEMRRAYPQWAFDRQESSGPEQARNAAAGRARGELLLFHDPGCIALPHMVRVLVDTLERAQADCVSCWLRGFAGAEIPDEDTQPLFSSRFVGPCLEYGCLENVLGEGTFLVKRTVFASLGGFKPGQGAAMDWEFLLQLSLAGHRLAVAPEELIWQRAAADSTHAGSNDYQDRLRVLRPYSQRDPLLGQVLSELTVPMWDRLRHLRRRVEKLERQQAFVLRLLTGMLPGRAGNWVEQMARRVLKRSEGRGQAGRKP